MEPARLIATALPEELAALLRRAREVRRRGTTFTGSLGGRRVRLACTGSGATHAGRGLARLLAEAPVPPVIGAGIAGALTPGLARGDVVVTRCVLDADGEAGRPDEAWRERALRLGARDVVAVSVDHVVTRPAERQLLAERFSAGALASVDMESASWSRAALRAGVPFVAVRAISEAASEVLPDYLSRCLDAEGGLSRWRIALAALARPSSLRSLLRLRRQAVDAAERLSAFVEELLKSAPAEPEDQLPSRGRTG